MASKTLDPIDILLELGIDLDDLSEQDYLSALMEAIATIEFQTKGKGDERSAVLREEVIKIRKGKRKPQAKRTKISADMLRPSPKLMGTANKINPSKLLPPSQEESTKEPEQDSIIKILTDISESVKSILFSLKASNDVSKNLAEDERKRRETKKRTGAENKLEKKRFEGLKKIGSKLIQPIKGPIDALFNFLKNVILGRILINIINWLGNPENQKKLESLGRFFMDWWPTLVTAVLLFGTGLGGLLKSIVGITFKFIPKLLGLIPGLLKFLKSPMGLATGVAALGAAAIAQNQKGTAVIKDPDDPDKSQMDDTRDFGGMSADPFSGLFNGGGQVPGRGPNKDTVPAMLSPGEFVMSRGAVDKWGSGMLASMNAAGGGDNRPMMSGGTTYAVGGGMIGGDHKEKMPAEHARLMAQRDKEVQASGGVDERHNQLMQSTSQERIAAYDKKHGEGAYSKKLREKLAKTYSTPSPYAPPKPAAPAETAVKPTGKVVGRENLSPEAQAAIARLESKRGLPPDMQYTRNGRKISAKQFNRVQGMMGAVKEGGARGALDHMISGAKNMFGGMFSKVQGAIKDPKSFVESMGGTVRDGNIGTPTAEEQKAIDALAAKKAKLQKTQQNLLGIKNTPKKRIQDDPLYAEYTAIENNPHHPLFEKVRGSGDLDDFGMSFSEFKKFKAQQKFGGGEIKESSGQNYPGGTADRQLVRAQPGEYMLPVDTVNNLGGPAKLDKLVAQTDSNSTPAKLGMRSKEIPQVGAPMPMQPKINLIPTQSGGKGEPGTIFGSALPNFDAGTGDPNKAKLLGVVR